MTLTFLPCALIVTLILELLALFSQSWFILALDLNKCLTCGSLIVSIGDLMENSTMFPQFREVKDVSLATTEVNDTDNAGSQNGAYIDRDSDYRYVFNETTKMTLFGDDPDSVYESVLADFEITNSLHVSMGLWYSTVCTENRTMCLTLGLETTRSVFGQLPMLDCLRGGLFEKGAIVLLSAHVTLFTLTVALMSLRTHTSKYTSVLMKATIVTVVLKLKVIIGMALSYWSHSVYQDGVVTFELPWAIFSLVLSTYIQLFVILTLAIRKSTVPVYISWQKWRSIHL